MLPSNLCALKATAATSFHTSFSLIQSRVLKWCCPTSKGLDTQLCSQGLCRLERKSQNPRTMHRNCSALTQAKFTCINNQQANLAKLAANGICQHVPSLMSPPATSLDCWPSSLPQLPGNRLENSTRGVSEFTESPHWVNSNLKHSIEVQVQKSTKVHYSTILVQKEGCFLWVVHASCIKVAASVFSPVCTLRAAHGLDFRRLT